MAGLGFFIWKEAERKKFFLQASGGNLLLKDKFHFLWETNMIYSVYLAIFCFHWEEHDDSFLTRLIISEIMFSGKYSLFSKWKTRLCGQRNRLFNGNTGCLRYSVTTDYKLTPCDHWTWYIKYATLVSIVGLILSFVDHGIGNLISSVKDDSIYGISNNFFQVVIWKFKLLLGVTFLPFERPCLPSVPMARSARRSLHEGWDIGHGDGAAPGSLLDFSERSYVPSGHWHPVLMPAEYGWTHMVWGHHVGLCCWGPWSMLWLRYAHNRPTLAHQSSPTGLARISEYPDASATENCLDTYLIPSLYLIFSKKPVLSIVCAQKNRERPPPLWSLLHPVWELPPVPPHPKVGDRAKHLTWLWPLAFALLLSLLGSLSPVLWELCFFPSYPTGISPTS